MTGWQGDGGAQDGPQGGAYGGWGPHEPEPYGQDPYYLDPYAYPPPPPPPPPPRSRLPMILGVLAIVLIVGAVVTIVLITRKSGGTPTAGPTTAPVSSPTGEPSSSPAESPAESSPAPDGREGWQTIDNSADSGLIYEVPPEWKVVPGSRPSGLGVDFTGTADYGTYQCEGATYVRSYATSGDVQAKDKTDLDLAKTVKDFAEGFGKSSFNDTARVTVPEEPERYEIDGHPAARLAAKVTPEVTVPACQASEGEVALVGVLVEEDGKPAGVAMLAVVSDVAGGPVDPKSLPKTVAQEILASIRVG